MPPDIGRRLRWLRHMRGLKQSVVAEWAGVTQTTISRWERGDLRPEPGAVQGVLDLLGGNTASLVDKPLSRLIETSGLPVHLIDDSTHRLLAASPGREREWGRSASELIGQSLWCFATVNIQEAEAALTDCGWWQNRVPHQIVFSTEAGDAGLCIRPQIMSWDRLYLADGTPARLCTTIEFL